MKGIILWNKEDDIFFAGAAEDGISPSLALDVECAYHFPGWMEFMVKVLAASLAYEGYGEFVLCSAETESE